MNKFMKISGALALMTMSLGSCFAAGSVSAGVLSGSDLFTSRDLQQSADLSDAAIIGLSSRSQAIIADEGVYILSGTYADSTVVVDAGDDAKVQLVLDGFNVKNSSAPAIYVKSADKVFLTAASDDNSIEVTGRYKADGSTNLDAAVFSRADLVINGTGSLEVISAAGNGISTKDDLKITGSSLYVKANEDALEANDSIRIYDGNIVLESGKDALHAEDSDKSTGYIYIQGGSLDISAGDDAVRGTSLVQVDGGTLDIKTSQEGLEATHIQINGGDIDIYATDDGINAARKSNGTVMIEVNGGDISVSMAAGDTDAFDSNGDLYIRGGDIDVTARSAFDADGTAEMTGGDVKVNGSAVTEITVQSFGRGGAHGGRRW